MQGCQGQVARELCPRAGWVVAAEPRPAGGVALSPWSRDRGRACPAWAPSGAAAPGPRSPHRPVLALPAGPRRSRLPARREGQQEG